MTGAGRISERLPGGIIPGLMLPRLSPISNSTTVLVLARHCAHVCGEAGNREPTRAVRFCVQVSGATPFDWSWAENNGKLV